MSEFELAQADALLRAAEAVAEEISVSMSFAAVDSGGHLLCFRRMDGAPWIGADVAIGKAYTAAAYGVPTSEKAQRARELIHFTNAVIAMTAGRYVPQDGGLPVLRNGVVIGGLGASGGTGSQDEHTLRTALERQG
ncbi:MAG: hypothetical protein JWM36_4863 [Hyphomicrobiales bacterium]|jgi:uncharacterized protein GlcG (DUF336 family)|nr:hypothetical protein [Hyphomicrobiales bacterium]